MQKIRFTYTSSRVQESVVILLYLRMNGIYVYERYFDISKRTEKEMLDIFKEEDLNPGSAFNQFDMEMFLIGNEKEYSQMEEMGADDKTIIIICDDFDKKGRYRGKEVFYGKGAYDRHGLYRNFQGILQGMLDNHIIDADEHNTLEASAKIYCKYDVMKLFLRGKFFYGAENEVEYRDICDKYGKVIDAIFEYLERRECNWGDISTIYLQYAALYMAYESDLYCIRNRRELNYDVESIEQICKSMLYEEPAAQNMGDSLGQLLAQIEDDLQGDAKKAYDSYLDVCKDYNAYVYFRKALYWMDFREDYRMTVKYLAKSLMIYPEYYRAWYRLGFSYTELGKLDKALQAFENMETLIIPRLKNNQIRPMEIEYLFKAKNQCGFIYKVKNNLIGAIRAYLMAEKIWEAIEKTEFISFMSYDNADRAGIIRRTKSELDIRRVYRELWRLFSQTGEKDMAKYYLDKYKGETKDE